jgi:hypothetical protein
MPAGGATFHGDILVRFGRHHSVADQSGACVTASPDKKPGFSS